MMKTKLTVAASAVALLAIAKIGAVINPVNFRLTPREIAFTADDADTMRKD